MRESDGPEVRTRSRLLRRVTLSLVEPREGSEEDALAATGAAASDRHDGAAGADAERRRERERERRSTER